MSQNNDVFTISRNGIVLQRVVHNARKEGHAFHVERNRIDASYISACHDLDDLRHLHDSGAEHNSVSKRFAH